MESISLHKKDALISIVLFMLAAVASYSAGLHLNTEGLRKENVWFQSDIGRVYKNMTERFSNHYRTKVHPVFSLTTAPLVHGLSKLGMTKETAVRTLVAGVAGIWLAAFYLVLRLLCIRVTDALVFTILISLSGAALFWLTVPETYLFGSLTMLVVLGFVALSEARTFPAGYWVGISALSLSMTVTNWMAGIVATLASNSLRKTVRITTDAFVVVTVLWAIQHAIFPSSEFFLLSPEERDYMLSEDAGGLTEKATVFFLHTVILPEVQILANRWATSWPFFSVQFSAVGSTGLLGLGLSVVWGILLVVGVWTAWLQPAFRKFKIVLAVIIGGQFLLHMIYGEETFLYSLHWAPMLVLVAAFGLSSIHRRWVLGLAILFVVGLGFNNVRQFERVSSELWKEKYGAPISQRETLISAMEEHPWADWPRGLGHVLLANVGSRLEHKGYHEPGGSFSPGFGSFGISIILFDRNGNLKASSNSIPLDEIKQSIDLAKNSIGTTTRWYSTKWTALPNGEYTLDFSSKSELIPVLKITSSGPAGAPLNHLSWEGNTLTVNKQYEVIFEIPPENLSFADERSRPTLPIETASNRKRWTGISEGGFGRALFSLPGSASLQVWVKTLQQGANDALSSTAAKPVRIALPDEEFVNSLEAQLFHLKAGIVERETRPGDPGNYDVNWLRDGAYVIVALARSGEHELAKRLVSIFAEEDFFGGFGAEADAPGLAIWALDEIASRLNDPQYDKWIWPHVERKASLIAEMLDASMSIKKGFSGPIVPNLHRKRYSELALVADSASEGLIVGKMDNHRPVFYVNGTAYLGLKRAAGIADRLGLKREAKEYRLRAAGIQTAWHNAIGTHKDSSNHRTIASALWPTEIATGIEEEVIELLEDSWSKRRDGDGGFLVVPKWTYFDIAEAHQWLLVGNRRNVWATLEWFWANQASPGLFSWWEGSGEENSFGLWQTVRGWFAPQHVTPHYWSAAEMALLQFDMLAHESEVEGRAGIVIGLGLPDSWLESPMSVEGLSLRSGRLDWRWDGRNMEIKWAGTKDVDFALAPSFPVGARIINMPRETSTPPSVAAGGLID